MMDVERVGTQAELARLLGVSEPAVTDYVHRGIVRPGDTLAEQVRAVFAHLRAVAAGRVEPAGIAEQRERLLAAKAARAELELAERQGRLVRAADVARAARSLLRAARDTIRAWPARLAPILAAESSATECERRLAVECDQLVEQLAQLPGAVVRSADAGAAQREAA
jgi:phage terminase Nu1 subunit (DNA packaging protein)